jgi:hypothetical protein
MRSRNFVKTVKFPGSDPMSVNGDRDASPDARELGRIELKARLRWNRRWFGGTLLLFVLSGLLPVAFTGFALRRLATGSYENWGECIRESAFALLMTAFGTMVLRLIWDTVSTWQIKDSHLFVRKIILPWHKLKVEELRSFKSQWVPGRPKYAQAGYWTLLLQSVSGDVHEFSSRIILNNPDLVQYLKGRGISEDDALTNSSALRIWLGHLLVMGVAIAVIAAI